MSTRIASRLSFVLLFALSGALVAGATTSKKPSRNDVSASIAPADGTPEIEITCAGTMVPAVVHVQRLGKNPSSVSDPNLAKNRYDWDFGDEAGKWNTLTGFNAAHVYDKPGVYTIGLTVTDPAGKTAKRQTKVKIGADSRK